MARKTAKLNTRFDHPLEMLVFYAGLPRENDENGQPKDWLTFFTNEAWLPGAKANHNSYNRVMIVKNCNIAPMANEEEQYTSLRVYHAAVILLRNNDIRRAFFVSTTQLLEEILEKHSPGRMLDEINPELGNWFEELCFEVIDAKAKPMDNAPSTWDELPLMSFPGWPDEEQRRIFKDQRQVTTTALRVMAVPSSRIFTNVTYRLTAPGIRLEAWHYCLLNNVDMNEAYLIQKDEVVQGMTVRPIE